MKSLLILLCLFSTFESHAFLFGNKKCSGDVSKVLSNKSKYNFSPAQIGNFISTEPHYQSGSKIRGIRKKLRESDLYVFKDSIDLLHYRGKYYVLDGHHRLIAIYKEGYKGQTSIKVLSMSEAKRRYRDCIEEITQGDHTLRLKSSNI